MTPRRPSPANTMIVLLLLGLSCASARNGTPGAPPSPQSFAPVVDAPDRSADDKKSDGHRKPAELLAFIGVRSGFHIADLGAGEGYSTELLVRAVGPQGEVFAQNSPFMLKKFMDGKWPERYAKPIMSKVVQVNREFDDPLPAEAKALDAVVLALFYHDTVWLEADRNKMNRAVFQALRPGGVYVVIDHSAKDGAGVSQASQLHRIEEKVVRSEVEAAGFKLIEESSFLRNPGDKRDFNVIDDDRVGQSDRFSLKFVRP